MIITIELEIDDFTGKNYKDLSPECKQSLIDDVRMMLKNTVNNERKAKLKKILGELQNESGGSDLDPEILYALLRGEDD